MGVNWTEMVQRNAALEKEREAWERTDREWMDRLREENNSWKSAEVRLLKEVEVWKKEHAQAHGNWIETRKKVATLSAQKAGLVEALERLTMWLSTWRHSIVIRAEGAGAAWDQLEEAHNRGCSALAAAAKEE